MQLGKKNQWETEGKEETSNAIVFIDVPEGR